jgi:hypothetical protein
MIAAGTILVFGPFERVCYRRKELLDWLGHFGALASRAKSHGHAVASPCHP